MPVSPSRYDVFRKRYEVFARMVRGVERGNPRSLHRMRLASRRLRELLPLIGLDAGETRKLTRRLRRVTDQLGVVREADVLTLLLDELQESGRYHQASLGLLAAAVTKEREAAAKRLDEKLPMAELRRLSHRLGQVADDLERSKPSKDRRGTAWQWAVDARVANRADQLSVAMREAGAVYLPERLHVVRIALKKLRYAVELSREIFGGDQADVKVMKHAQDLLGRMHDLQVLIDRVRQLQAVPPGDVRAERELEAIVDALEDDCRRLHARYTRERPALAAICARAKARPAASQARRAITRRAAS